LIGDDWTPPWVNETFSPLGPASFGEKLLTKLLLVSIDFLYSLMEWHVTFSPLVIGREDAGMRAGKSSQPLSFAVIQTSGRHRELTKGILSELLGVAMGRCVALGHFGGGLDISFDSG
jgi:hypothetical protein